MTKDGKEFERLIQLIEKSISQGSTVEHDVHLPVIGSPSGRTRQCDIVIRSGSHPRETVTIVEAQDRSRPVEQTIFGGWLKKLEEVGAQHLICVSYHDYPNSIKEEAFKLGNTVRLITLKELDAESIPVDFFNMSFIYRRFDLTKITDLSLGTSKTEAEELDVRDAVKEKSKHPLNANERCWSLDKQELISLFILCRDFFHIPEGETAGEGYISFSREEEPPLFMFIDDNFLRVSLDCTFSWTNEEVQKPVNILSYEQGEDGTLAWVIEAFHETPKGPLSFRAPVVKCGDKFLISSFLTTMPEEHELSIFKFKK